MSVGRRLAEASKAIAATRSAAAVMVGAGLITGSTAVWLTGALAAAAAGVGTYLGRRNADPAGKDSSSG